LLCKEVYHCSPDNLDNVEEKTLDLHFDFYQAEKKEEWLESQRLNQRNNLNTKKH